MQEQTRKAVYTCKTDHGCVQQVLRPSPTNRYDVPACDAKVQPLNSLTQVSSAGVKS